MKYIMVEDLNNLYSKEKHNIIQLSKRIKFLKDNNIDIIKDGTINVPVEEYFSAVGDYVINNYNNIMLKIENKNLFNVLNFLLFIILYFGIGILLTCLLICLTPTINNIVILIIILFIFDNISLRALIKLKKELKQYE